LKNVSGESRITRLPETTFRRSLRMHQTTFLNLRRKFIRLIRHLLSYSSSLKTLKWRLRL